MLKVYFPPKISLIYKNLKREYKRKLNLEDVTLLNKIDPTAFIRNKTISGNYLGWIVKDYIERLFKKLNVNDYFVSDEAIEVNNILGKFLALRKINKLPTNDIYKFTFSSLNSFIKEIESLEGEIRISGLYKDTLLKLRGEIKDGRI